MVHNNTLSENWMGLGDCAGFCWIGLGQAPSSPRIPRTASPARCGLQLSAGGRGAALPQRLPMGGLCPLSEPAAPARVPHAAEHSKALYVSSFVTDGATCAPRTDCMLGSLGGPWP